MRDIDTNAVQLFGNSGDRTSWVIYNSSTLRVAYWANQRLSGTSDGFILPSGGSFGVKIPEDDPTKEVWIRTSLGSASIYVYEGFANLKGVGR